MQLTKNFSLGELIASQTASRCGVSNLPETEDIKNNLLMLCEQVLQPLRDHIKKPIFVSSGYRNTWLNKEIKGATTSQHCFGLAADIEVPGIPNPQLAKRIIDLHLPFNELILEFWKPKDIGSQGWIHVSYEPKKIQEILWVYRVPISKTKSKTITKNLSYKKLESFCND